MGSFSIWHWLIVLLFVLPISFLPSIIAFARGHAQKWIVFIVNFFLGWTGIGWIVALVWAIVGKTAAQARIDNGVFQ
ncbi:superinfection immunity protein [Novosphingobium resinovorum]|uniref:superinfection immunity protein n=1 Tax=Novosphingobium resinovorum TaxID=158500 RepID=UPI002ED1360F|nr:superinfection immunity protein [Novosphingobium resinovorum]